ncbi:hypothetical protein PFICI_10360 [Pestalotiopsis fici W106-1]|uniref:FAD-dependent oxidoreductase-like enzyme n=1 Tax=Pestalotiopsis fici (strain W106-1 / CGMCC3.15140) TaxID=1229662 RepID=W3WWP4_PESFW|nr:uncharacterized protein PFICI_10360 [Pestalotiopsis fici W106-1]ETS78298.1 hypothetical protein PFICI_10360 [Pestalotiopsis fici W106-1]
MTAGTQQPNGVVRDAPSTPPEAAMILSQQSLPSTEEPSSPADPASSFKTELNDDRPASPLVIPSSLTPPPSSQPPQPNGAAGQPLGYTSLQRSSMFSPPATTTAPLRRDSHAAPADHAAPTGEQIDDASADDLRQMLRASLSDNARLKMEIAHHKLQYNLLSMQADEAAKRAAVEHEMTKREVEVLRVAESARQARRDQEAAVESIQLKYIQLKASYEAACDDIDSLRKREKRFKKVLQQKEDEIISLTDDRELLLQRIRENREHFNILRSPGGVLHGSVMPRLPPIVSPQQHRTTPRQTPRSHRREEDENQRGFQVLLQALNHDNNSAPSTPTSSHHPTPRTQPKHTRGAQSMSSLPTTPMAKPRGQHSTLLPSIDLVPRTEPVPRFGPIHHIPEPRSVQRRKSRESTISADDNEELARAALSMAAVNRSMMSASSDRSVSRAHRRPEGGEEVYQSQASQAASEMLRRDPRESFDEVASSGNSRDATPAPAERSMKLQTRLFAPITKPGLGAEKRKYTGHQSAYTDGKHESFTSPAKKLRVEPRSADARRVGLGIQYSP